jgi:hypothetical protein
LIIIDALTPQICGGATYISTATSVQNEDRQKGRKSNRREEGQRKEERKIRYLKNAGVK